MTNGKFLPIEIQLNMINTKMADHKWHKTSYMKDTPVEMH